MTNRRVTGCVTMRMTWIEYTVSNIQTALVVLKVLGYITASWWVVLLPVMVLLVLEFFWSCTIEVGMDREEDK